MSLDDLDSIDRKILTELDKNARISYSELGKRIRVAKETVKYRIAQLEKQGQPIGSLDMLIAAHASSLSLSLITNNLREFKKVPGLNVESWV